MADRTPGKETGIPNGDLIPAEAAKALVELEQRVTRLEDAFAALQDTDRLEARLVERVVRRLDQDHERGGVLPDAGRDLLPGALHLIQGSSPSPAFLRERPMRSWLLYDLYAEGRAIIRMYFDRRYRLPWIARVVPLVLLVAILTSAFWVPGTSITVVGTIFDKVFDLLLAFCAVKILSREARRYRAALGELPGDPAA